MEVNRCRNDKVKCAVIDTNILMYSFLNRIDVFDQLRDLGFKRFLVPLKVLKELENLSCSLRGREKIAARFALELVRRFCEVVNTNAVGTDSALIEVARKFKCVLITNDKKLKKKAKELGIPIGYLRGLKVVEMENFY